MFRDILPLEDVSIPGTVEYIGARAFHGTAWLEKQKKRSPMVAVDHMLLDGSGCLGEVIVPEDIRLICGWAFANGMGIEKIRFLSDRVRVEDYAFIIISWGKITGRCINWIWELRTVPLCAESVRICPVFRCVREGSGSRMR